MPNRSIPPPFQTIRQLQIPRLTSQTLSNGIRVHWLNAGVQDVFRMEVIFPAGNYYEAKMGAAYFTVKMLAEGTQRKTTSEISESIDRLGGFAEYNHGVERLGITLFGLSRYLGKFFYVLKEIIEEAAFPENELLQIQNLTRQNLKVNQGKNAFVASKKFRELIFGPNHPYGRQLTEEDVDSITRNDLKEHYQKYIFQHPFDFILVGNFQNKDFDEICENLDNWIIQEKTKTALVSYNFQPSRELKSFIKRDDKTQSSIRVGRPLFTKNHPDYFRLAVLNEVFGGYYGSRLMRNLREDKGFTYGVYSSLAMLKRTGYWIIGTDVKKEFTQQTLQEIRNEANRLREELIDEQELATVRNYMAGSFAGSLNTSFELAEVFKSIYYNNLSYDFYNKYLENINQIAANEIRETARQYLDIENFYEVVVGDNVE